MRIVLSWPATSWERQLEEVAVSWKWAADLTTSVKHALGFATGPRLKWEDLEEPANDIRKPQIM